MLREALHPVATGINSMDTVSDLSFFVQLARQGSLAATAQQLGVTPPTVSKRLAALELRLGVRLLNRTTRRVSLTAEGEAYLADGSRLLAELAALEHTLSGSRAAPRGLLRVNATLGFGQRHVAPAISKFVSRHAEVEVQLHLSDRPLNLVEEGFDVGIRIGELPEQRLTARKIACNRRVLVATPAYLKRAGEPASPRELAKHLCIVTREGDEAYGTWQLSSGTRHESVKVRGALSVNHGETALAWALDGQGILLRSLWDAARYLRSGRLRQVLPAWSPPPADIFAVYPTKSNLSAKTRAFVDFLGEYFVRQAGRPEDAW
jgi:DNA-binding transcriptional LysR family regulator